MTDEELMKMISDNYVMVNKDYLLEQHEICKREIAILKDEEIMQLVFDYEDGKQTADEIRKQFHSTDDLERFTAKLNEFEARCDFFYVPMCAG